MKGYGISVVTTRKPNLVIEEATATIDVVGTADWDLVVDAGLAALGEARSSLYGYGIKGYRDGEPVSNTVCTVYAHRD